MTIHDIYPNVQAVHRVYESDLLPSFSETIYFVCHPESILGKNILLWDDILGVFSGTLYVRVGAIALPFLKGLDFKNDKHQHAPQEPPTEDLKDIMMNARLGDKHAQNALGETHKDGRGVHQDHQAVVNWFLKATEQGLARAQFNIDDLYDYGRGIPLDTSR
ncbi:hypothetical protein BG015_007476 [Linnemannia schmuckeri]|uniref:Uncharacterized protein n=1 Tax=Linnemannia schmuckeri TaxID=64567 RepID=A0A9P5S1Z5_9FUNG|nr:hypothetical protein BG015_007476 [Linnemannia schmuckeri]